MAANIVLPSIQVDVDRARAFVLAHGGPRETARLEGILGAVGPNRDVVKTVEALQHADGSFSEAVSATCEVLQQLKQMPPLAGSPMASRAVAYLRRMQETDGSWGGDLVLTTMAAYAVLTLDSSHMEPLNRAGSWLRRALGPDSSGEDTPAAVLARAWAVWYRLMGPDSQEASWAFAQLERRELSADDLALWLACGAEMAAGGRYALPLVRGLGRLSSGQGPDGAWTGGVEATLQALWVFRRYGVI